MSVKQRAGTIDAMIGANGKQLWTICWDDGNVEMVEMTGQAGKSLFEGPKEQLINVLQRREAKRKEKEMVESKQE